MTAERCLLLLVFGFCTADLRIVGRRGRGDGARARAHERADCGVTCDAIIERARGGAL